MSMPGVCEVILVCGKYRKSKRWVEYADMQLCTTVSINVRCLRKRIDCIVREMLQIDQAA